MSLNRSILGLGLESSCDETSAAVVKNGSGILSHEIFSQVDLHGEYFGVVPEIASRAHLEVINGLIQKSLDDAGITFSDLDYVAATQRPGLVGSLLIAVQSAKAISFAHNIPFIAVNHLEAHLYAPFLEHRDPVYPFVGLLVSGGNTAIYIVRGTNDYELIGKTVDDAVGEAYDKVSKFLNLGYPGGPHIERLARTARLKKQLFPKILADTGSEDNRFSYSGIKTAVVNYIRQNPDADTAQIVWSFQERALELLVRRVFKTARSFNIHTIVVAGGVAANGRLRELLQNKKKDSEDIIIPSPLLCTDNGAMVAGIGYRYHSLGIHHDLHTDVKARA
jgi:N6-L-threonylcarbamoyladenine synthase